MTRQIEFPAVRDEEVRRVCQEITTARGPETTRCAICEVQPPLTDFNTPLKAVFNGNLTPVLDAFAAEKRLKSLDVEWVEVDEDTARWILVRSLSRDLAYAAELMRESEAESLVRQLLSVCARGTISDRRRFFTNGKVVDGPSMYNVGLKRLVGWNPATAATFDTGVIVVTRRRIGLVWVEDED